MRVSKIVDVCSEGLTADATRQMSGRVALCGKRVSSLGKTRDVMAPTVYGSWSLLLIACTPSWTCLHAVAQACEQTDRLPSLFATAGGARVSYSNDVLKHRQLPSVLLWCAHHVSSRCPGDLFRSP